MSFHQPSSLQVAAHPTDVTIDGLRLYTRILALAATRPTNAPWLVFLHEGLGCTDAWHDFPAKVVQATRLPALLYDRQGYGRSQPRREPPGVDYLQVEAEAVLPALLTHFGIDRPILIGHSDGGTIALLYAARYPRQVLGIIAEAAHVLVETVTLAGIRATVEAFRHGDLEARLSRYHGAHTRQTFFNWADTWLSDDFRDWNIEACLPKIRSRLLVLQGLADPYGTAHQAAAIAAGAGGRVRQVLIPDCGHVPHRQAPRRTLAAVHRFISRTPRPTIPPGATVDQPC